VDVEAEGGNLPLAPFTISHSAGRTLIVNRPGGQHQGVDEILCDSAGSIFECAEAIHPGWEPAHWVRPKPEKRLLAESCG
jgi:hypothetical protein